MAEKCEEKFKTKKQQQELLLLELVLERRYVFLRSVRSKNSRVSSRVCRSRS